MRLTNEIKDRIQQDPALYAAVCQILGRAPASLPAILKKNDGRLLQLNVINAIKKITGMSESQILDYKADKVTA